MISADSSVLIDYINGDATRCTVALKEALAQNRLQFSPPVITELYGIRSPENQRWHMFVAAIPLLPVTDGYWQRAGETRRKLLQRGLKAKLGDALIAQSCIDHDIPLLTRDVDFRHYAEHCGLKLALPLDNPH